MLYLGNTRVATTLTKEEPSVLRQVDSNGVFQIPKSGSADIVLSDNALDVGERAFYFAFYKGTGINSFNANNVATITGDNAFNSAFYNNTTMTKLEFPELISIASGSTIMGYVCHGCTNLNTLSFPKLKTITASGVFYYAFYNCKGLTEVSFPSLDEVKASSIFNYAFYSCTNVKNVYFNALKSTSFGNYTDQFSEMLSGISGCTVHLPSSLNGHLGNRDFGGSGTIIVYDLPATE